MPNTSLLEEPAQILTQVDLLSLKLASHLGGEPAGPEVGTGLTSAMTDNLQAYRYYSLAVEKAQALDNVEALNLLEKAVEIDPQFAMAHARIGFAYVVTSHYAEKAKPHLEKAFQLSNRLTEKDSNLRSRGAQDCGLIIHCWVGRKQNRCCSLLSL